MPTTDRDLTVTDLTGQAGSFGIGPINLHVPAGRVLVVLGPSGARKTMLLETIAGLRPQRSGQVRLAGTDLTALPPERRGIGLVSQDAALFPHLSVSQNVAFGPRASQQTSGADAGALLRRLRIAHLASRAPRSLSGGERQRVALAGALAITPRLLLLDEPLSALDQPTREEMRALLQELLADLEIPAVHVTHDRDEALSIGDNLAIIATGQLRQTGPARLAPNPPTPAPRACSAGPNSDTAPPTTTQCEPPAPAARCGTPAHPGPRAYLLPARRCSAWHASLGRPGRGGQRYCADRAGAAYPAARPGQPGLRPPYNSTRACLLDHGIRCGARS